MANYYNILDATSGEVVQVVQADSEIEAIRQSDYTLPSHQARLKVDSSTVWFKVFRSRSEWADDNKPWTISGRTGSQLSRYGKSQNGGDFATKDEAIAAGRQRGWILVDNWQQAQDQYAPYQQELYVKADRRREARTGTYEIRVQVGTERGKPIYVTRYAKNNNLVRQVMDLLANYDEFGVVQDD